MSDFSGDSGDSGDFGDSGEPSKSEAFIVVLAVPGPDSSDRSRPQLKQWSYCGIFSLRFSFNFFS